jgi:hypothetical protein
MSTTELLRALAARRAQLQGRAARPPVRDARPALDVTIANFLAKRDARMQRITGAERAANLPAGCIAQLVAEGGAWSGPPEALAKFLAMRRVRAS